MAQTTYPAQRERRLTVLDRGAERRIEATATIEADHERYCGDIAFLTQPGHMIARTDRAVAQLSEADRMEERARNIEDQLAGAIYSHDPDAIEQLQRRIAKLERKREAYKAHRGTDKVLPAYTLTNLGADIRRNQQRLEQLERQRTNPPPARPMAARFDADCSRCDERMSKGDAIYCDRATRPAWHERCNPL